MDFRNVGTVEEKRAALIMKYRNLKLKNKKQEGNIIRYNLYKDDKKYIMLCILNQNTIGISYVRDLKEMVDEEGAEKGILVGDGKYTYSAKSSSEKMGIELIPPTLPTFDIFKHEYVPKAEIVTGEELQKLLKRFHAQPYQYPWMKASDPVAIILGATPGDIIKIISKSETAGEYESYRYVV